MFNWFLAGLTSYVAISVREGGNDREVATNTSTDLWSRSPGHGDHAAVVAPLDHGARLAAAVALDWFNLVQLIL